MKKVGVIGAGPSGIAAVKQLKDEGHEVKCFEKGETIGGVFAPKGSTYDSCLLTVSNHFMAYSDLMPIEERLHFWTRNDYFRYLNRYAERFDLFPHIQTNTTVEKVVEQDGKWQVQTRRGDTVQTLAFDKLVVCTGAFQRPFVPDVPGLDKFTGDVSHSREYKNGRPFIDRKVLCVGMGETSADIATEIADVAERCIVSVRRYPRTTVRYVGDFNTIDTYTTRVSSTMSHRADEKFHKNIFTKMLKHRNPAVRLMAQWTMAAGSASDQVSTKNDRLFPSIADGKVQTNLSGVKRFEKNKVIFNDGVEEKVDTIVWCTGFTLEFPFLPEAYRFTNPRNLYKHIFHPRAGDSLAFVGFIRPLQGGVPVMSEMQSRYVAQVFNKKVSLPTKDKMKNVIVRDTKQIEEEFKVTPHVIGLVNYSHYMEDLARLVRCCPEISFFKDMRLYYKMFFAPHFAIQYRISGPHAFARAAKDFIRSYPIAVTKQQQRELLFYLLLGKLFPFGKHKFRMDNQFKNSF